jgi:hypothetical protein
MQIHEITHKQRLDEVDIIGGIKKAVSGVQGAVAGFQQSQQQRQVQQNTAALAKAALQQWNNKVIQLTQAAGGQPVDATEYENQLSDFVERVMLRSYKIADMEPQSQTRIEQALGAVVQGRNDRRALGPAFEKLVQQATVARLDPAKTSYQSPAAQKTVGPGAKQAPGAKTPAPPLNPAQAASVVNTAIRKASIDPAKLATELETAAGGTVAAQRTNNTVANALLKASGIQVQ